ncbi:MAG: EAL domain-containing protein [Alphaproteobacteria bacterium]|nr:EAL domain-containing protein [Alphaproteobacteria bacterium]
MYLENKKPIEKLRLALTTGAIKAYYQPEIDFSLPNWLGFEALTRRFDPDLGEVSPAQFIPWAQVHGLLAQLTLMQIRQMEQDAPKLLSQQKHISLGLNLSPSLLGHHEIWAAFEKATHVTRQWPITWEVELSESEAIHDFGLARHFLRELQQMGIKVLLDDFGTGWSNPTRLEMLDIDGIKVDAIFVRSALRLHS